jgi:hypothetical protein
VLGSGHGEERKGLLLAIAAIGFASVAVQFYLTLTSHPDHTVLWRVIDFLSYFTNTTAILATAVAILALVRPPSRLAQPGAITATAVYILVVAVTYQVLLSGETHGLRASLTFAAPSFRFCFGPSPASVCP